MAKPCVACPGCGLFVEPSRRCSECRAPLDRRGDAPPASPLVFVRASWGLRCPACSADNPLSRLVAPAGVCSGCQAALAVPRDGLVQLLGMAHDVAALAGAGADGKLAKRAFGLGCDVRRGHPCCGACKRFLEIEPGPDGAFRGRCPGCSALSSWRLAPGLRGIHDGLRVVFGAGTEELPEQAVEAVVELSPEKVATAVRCPSCNAPLSMPEAGGSLVTCKYCSTLCHLSIPSGPGRAAPAEPSLWLGFEGASPAQQKGQRRGAAKQAEAQARARRRSDDEEASPPPAGPDAASAPRDNTALIAVALLALVGLLVAALAAR